LDDAGFDRPGDTSTVDLGDVGRAAVVDHPAANEEAPTYLLDGAQVTDPVLGTFSSNFDYRSVARSPRPSPSSRREAPLAGLSEPVQAAGTTATPGPLAAAPAPPDSAVTITQQELARIPAGRAFASEVQAGPPPPPPPPPATVTAVSAALIIPVPGEVARLQHLLVPALDAAPLTLTLRPLRRSPR
jgi:hypothetical protein